MRRGRVVARTEAEDTIRKRGISRPADGRHRRGDGLPAVSQESSQSGRQEQTVDRICARRVVLQRWAAQEGLQGRGCGVCSRGHVGVGRCRCREVLEGSASRGCPRRCLDVH